MDKFVAARIAEAGRDVGAGAAADGLGFGGRIGGDAARNLGPGGIEDADAAALIEAALDLGDPGGEEAFARRQCARGARVDMDRSARREAAADPRLVGRGGGPRGGDERGAGTVGEACEGVEFAAVGDDRRAAEAAGDGGGVELGAHAAGADTCRTGAPGEGLDLGRDGGDVG